MNELPKLEYKATKTNFQMFDVRYIAVVAGWVLMIAWATFFYLGILRYFPNTAPIEPKPNPVTPPVVQLEPKRDRKSEEDNLIGRILKREAEQYVSEAKAALVTAIAARENAQVLLAGLSTSESDRHLGSLREVAFLSEKVRLTDLIPWQDLIGLYQSKLAETRWSATMVDEAELDLVEAKLRLEHATAVLHSVVAAVGSLRTQYPTLQSIPRRDEKPPTVDTSSNKTESLDWIYSQLKIQAAEKVKLEKSIIEARTRLESIRKNAGAAK